MEEHEDLEELGLSLQEAGAEAGASPAANGGEGEAAFEEPSAAEAFLHEAGGIRLQFAIGRPMKVSDVSHAPAALCFYAHVALVLLLVVVGFLTGLLYTHEVVRPEEEAAAAYYNGTAVVGPEEGPWDPYDDLWDYFTETMNIQEIVRIWIACVICSAVAAVYGTGWFLLMCRFGRPTMYASLALLVLICMAASLFFFTIKGFVLGSILLFTNVLFLVAFFAWWKRLQVSSLLLTHAVMLLSERGSGIVGMVFASMAVYLVWFCIWAAAVLLSQQFADFSVILVWLCIAFLLFSWYWTSEVIKNVCHTVVAAMIGIRCLRPDQLRVTQRPLAQLLLRAVTVQFGSIVIGSTLSVPIEKLRNIVAFFQRSFDSLPDQCAPARKLWLPPMFLTEKLMTVFNTKAFTEVGMYGRPYFEASQGAFKLMLAFNVEQILLDSLVTSVVWLGAVIGGLLTGLVAAILAWAMGSPYFFLVFLLGFLTGYGTVEVMLECVNAAIVALLLSVCEAGADRAMELFPTLYERLHKAYGTTCFLFSEPPADSNS